MLSIYIESSKISDPITYTLDAKFEILYIIFFKTENLRFLTYLLHFNSITKCLDLMFYIASHIVSVKIRNATRHQILSSMSSSDPISY